MRLVQQWIPSKQNSQSLQPQRVQLSEWYWCEGHRVHPTDQHNNQINSWLCQMHIVRRQLLPVQLHVQALHSVPVRQVHSCRVRRDGRHRLCLVLTHHERSIRQAHHVQQCQQQPDRGVLVGLLSGRRERQGRPLQVMWNLRERVLCQLPMRWQRRHCLQAVCQHNELQERSHAHLHKCQQQPDNRMFRWIRRGP